MKLDNKNNHQHIIHIKNNNRNAEIKRKEERLIRFLYN